MKGIIFNLLEKVVSGEYGESAWDGLLEKTDLEGAYTSLGSYPDSDLLALVGAASRQLNVPVDDLVRWFGRKAMPSLASLQPGAFEPHTSTRPFLLTLNDVIHPEVRKLYPGADVPEFEFDASDLSVLKLEYSSPRKLCSLAEGLIEGAADYYRETAEISQSACMKRGDARCVILCSFNGPFHG